MHHFCRHEQTIPPRTWSGELLSHPVNAQHTSDARVPALHPCVHPCVCGIFCASAACDFPHALGALCFPLTARPGPGELATLQQRPPFMMLVCLPVAARVVWAAVLRCPCVQLLAAWSYAAQHFACCVGVRAHAVLAQRPCAPRLLAAVAASWMPAQGPNRLVCGCLSCCVLRQGQHCREYQEVCVCACILTHVVCVRVCA